MPPLLTGIRRDALSRDTRELRIATQQPQLPPRGFPARELSEGGAGPGLIRLHLQLRHVSIRSRALDPWIGDSQPENERPGVRLKLPLPANQASDSRNLLQEGFHLVANL